MDPVTTLRIAFVGGALALSTFLGPPIPHIRAASSATAQPSREWTCSSRTETLQGYHLDGSIDRSSVIHTTVTSCSGENPAGVAGGAGNALHTSLSRLGAGNTAARVRVARARVGDYLGNQVPIPSAPGPGQGNGCPPSGGGFANGSGTPQTSAYLHWFYVNPNDGQTIDYVYTPVSINGGGTSWSEGIGGGPPTIYTSVAVYYVTPGAPWSVAQATCP